MTNGTHEYRYSTAGYTNRAVQEGLYARVLGIVREIRDARRVCDLGCGNGSFALMLAATMGEVVGVDDSASGIAIAMKEASATGNVSFVAAGIDEALPSRLLRPGKPFDAVVSIDVIEHIYSPRVLIDAARQILRPGGALVLCTPYHGYLKNLAIGVLGRWDAHHGVGWDGGHIKFFSVRTLSAMLTECGFEVVDFRYFGRVRYLWKNMICLARKRQVESRKGDG